MYESIKTVFSDSTHVEKSHFGEFASPENYNWRQYQHLISKFYQKFLKPCMRHPENIKVNTLNKAKISKIS